MYFNILCGVVQFVYLKESFSPSLDEKISTLFQVILPAHKTSAKSNSADAESYGHTGFLPELTMGS